MRALVTGASSGLGRDFARELAKRGYDLVLVARRKDRLQQLSQELSMVKTEIICTDLSDVHAVYALYEQVRGDDLEVVINNAGFGLFGAFIDTDLDRELQMLDLNVRTVHILTKLFLRDFQKKNHGYLLNIASAAGFLPGPLMSTYYATKNYVLRLTEAIHEELRQQGSHVQISALCPGPVDTEFNDVAKVRFSLKGLQSRDVAAFSIRGLFAGKCIMVPGRQMRFVLAMRHFASEGMLRRITYHTQHRKNGKS